MVTIIQYTKRHKILAKEYSDGGIHIDPSTVPAPDYDKYKCTIVFDVDETLVSVRDGLTRKNMDVYIRPNAEKILCDIRELGNVEIILWTAGHMKHAECVVFLFEEHLGCGKLFNHVISRGGAWRPETNTHDKYLPKKLESLQGRGVNLSHPIFIIDDSENVAAKCNGVNAFIVPPFCHLNKYCKYDNILLSVYSITVLISNILKEEEINHHRTLINNIIENHPSLEFILDKSVKGCMYLRVLSHFESGLPPPRIASPPPPSPTNKEKEKEVMLVSPPSLSILLEEDEDVLHIDDMLLCKF